LYCIRKPFFLSLTTTWRVLMFSLPPPLSYAVQRICRDGLWKEIVEHGGTGTVYAACTSFPVFNRILLESIDGVMSSQSIDDFTVQPLIQNFVHRSDFSEHTYLYTQMFLHRLIQTTNAHNLKRLSQELAVSAKRHDADFVVRVKNYLQKAEPSRLTSVSNDIWSMQQPDSAQSLQAIAQVYRAYSSSPTSSSSPPPPPELLQEYEVLHFMVSYLFFKESRGNRMRDVEEKMAYLLGVACASPPNSSDGAVVTHSAEWRHRVTHTQAAVLRAAKMLLDVSILTPADFQSNFSELCLLIHEYPVVAMGIIHWIEKSLTNPLFYTTNYYFELIPMILFILQIVAEVHLLLRDVALRVLVSFLEVKTNLDPETSLQIHWKILDTVVAFAMMGHVLPVLQYVEQWVTTIDDSYVRHVLSQILEASEPPYAPSFTRAMLKIMCNPKSFGSFSSDGNIKAQFVHFIQRCSAFAEGDAADNAIWSEAKEKFAPA
jgi:negative elongation factor C/D